MRIQPTLSYDKTALCRSKLLESIDYRAYSIGSRLLKSIAICIFMNLVNDINAIIWRRLDITLTVFNTKMTVLIPFRYGIVDSKDYGL